MLLMQHMRWRRRCQVTDTLEDCPDVTRAQVEGAGKELASAAVRVLVQGLKMPDREVCTAHVL